MTDSDVPSPLNTPLSDATRERLQGISLALLRLHKVLLQVERGAYEKLYGRVLGGSELLQLLIQNPWFSWLGQVSGLVVQIDELLERAKKNKEPVTEQEAGAVLEQVRSLLRPDEGSGNSETFSRRYKQALQQNPDSILAHAEVIRFLPAVSQDSPPAK